jgi:hypothetical protein
MEQWLNIETLEDERPVIARLMVGTVGATAAMMVAGILWATTDASIAAMVIAAIGISIASFLIVSTALPLNCRIGPFHSRSLTCRLQGQRTLVDAIAVALTALVIANILTTTV